MAHVGVVLSRHQLLERVWGFDDYDSNVVEAHISALRRQLAVAGPRLVQAVRGFGYVLRVDDATPGPEEQASLGLRRDGTHPQLILSEARKAS